MHPARLERVFLSKSAPAVSIRGLRMHTLPAGTYAPSLPEHLVRLGPGLGSGLVVL